MPTLLFGVILIQVLSSAISIDTNDLKVEIGDEDGFGSQGELWRSCEEVPCVRNFVCVMRKLTCLEDECANISPMPLCVPGDPQHNCAFITCVDGFRCIHVEEKCESSSCLPQPRCIAFESLTDNVDDIFTTSAPPPLSSDNEPFADSPIMHLHIPMPSATGPSTRPPSSSLPPRTQISQVKERKLQRQPRTNKPGVVTLTTKNPGVLPPKKQLPTSLPPKPLTNQLKQKKLLRQLKTNKPEPVTTTTKIPNVESRMRPSPLRKPRVGLTKERTQRRKPTKDMTGSASSAIKNTDVDLQEKSSTPLPPKPHKSQAKERINRQQPRTDKPEELPTSTLIPRAHLAKSPSSPETTKRRKPVHKVTELPVASGTHRTISLESLTVTKDLVISDAPKNHRKLEIIQHGNGNTPNSSTPSNLTTSVNVLRSHVEPLKRNPIPIKMTTPRHQTEQKLAHHLRQPHNSLKDSNRFSIQHLQRSKTLLRNSKPLSVTMARRGKINVHSKPAHHQQPIHTKSQPVHRKIVEKKKPQNSRAISFIFLDADPQLVSAIGDFAYQNRIAQRRGLTLSRQNLKHDPCKSIKCSANQRCEAISETAAMCAQIPSNRNAVLQQISSPWALQPPTRTSTSLNSFVQGTVKTVQSYISQLECIFSGKCPQDSPTTTTTRPRNPWPVRDYQYSTRHPCDAIYCINGFCRVTNGQARCVPDYITNPGNQPVIITTTPRTTITTTTPTTTRRTTTTTTTTQAPLVCGNFEELKPCGKNCETTCTDGKLSCVPQCGSHECVCIEGFHRYAGFCVRPAICPVNPFAGGK